MHAFSICLQPSLVSCNILAQWFPAKYTCMQLCKCIFFLLHASTFMQTCFLHFFRSHWIGNFNHNQQFVGDLGCLISEEGDTLHMLLYNMTCSKSCCKSFCSKEKLIFQPMCRYYYFTCLKMEHLEGFPGEALAAMEDAAKQAVSLRALPQ